jgi:hypothetical protein
VIYQELDAIPYFNIPSDVARDAESRAARALLYIFKAIKMTSFRISFNTHARTSRFTHARTSRFTNDQQVKEHRFALSSRAEKCVDT